ncbi:hemin uptake protein HemP [Acidovorax sp. JHL-9]|uniref:hemin uptake protein HemP n=1 Tax=Acidovorax sp. JHL-9 TaxID=1276756 RepID=UPI00047E5F33|nr:hemin uptake protein HemP [Acidovorax sp. JHL-9]
MQATLTKASSLCFASSGSVDSLPAVPSSQLADTAAVDSSTLLQGHKTVAIRHNGSVYRLQATKLGKLILTK